LREEEEVEEEYGANNMHGTRSLPRLEAESLAEREFRIAVALQICSLVRGYEECLFKVSSNQPVFNRDKFLRTAPALFEDRRGNPPSGLGQPVTQSQKMLSPRSKRFLSILVNCQHFFQFLEMLDQDECAFFNEVMYTFDTHEDKKEQESSNLLLAFGSIKLEEAAASLSKVLQKVEDKIPTYRVERKGKKKRRGGWEDDDDDDGGIHDLIETNDGEQELGFSDDGNLISSFTNELLQQVSIEPPSFRRNSSSDGDDALTHVSDFSDGRNQGAMTAQFLAEFEKGNHWHYNKLFGIPLESTDEKPVVEIREKVKLRDAIGERRYRAWKIAQEQKNADKDSTGKILTGDISSSEANVALDLTSLLSQVSDETSTTDSSSTFSSFSERTRKIISTLTPEQQRVQDAKDRDVLRRCLEKAYEGGSNAQRRQVRSNRLGLSHTMGGSENFENSGGRLGRNVNTQAQTGGPTDIFFENGRDLIADAEAALRNPSAQKFLISVLSQRSRLENQRKRRGASDDRGRRGGNQSTLSRLEPPAFDCLVRLCCAMLDACLENRNYEAGYNLLTQTQGFCSVHQIDGKPVSRKDSNVDNSNVIYMTARISLHPIFAESELWEGVLQMKLEEVEKERKDDDSESKDYTKDFDQIAYDTTVSTLYEMLAFGVPSEELARFATCVSEKKGWFATERGHNLLLQARRLSAKRENGNEATRTPGDLEIMRGGKRQAVERQSGGIGLIDEKEGKLHWKEIGWCHPAAVTSSRPLVSTSQENESQIASNTKVGQSLLNMIGNENKREDPDTGKYLKRSPVTSLAVFGPSLVASGGLDGSVFVAHSFLSAESTKDLEPIVRGVRLDWGSSGSRTTVTATTSSSMDGEYGVGAVSCLAAANGAGIRNNTLALNNSSFNRDVSGKHDEDDMLQAMDGCRVVAGTTGGDLRVWSVKEVVAATALTKRGESDDITYPPRTTHGGPDGVTSSFSPRPKRGSITEIAAGSAFSRLKVSLRGRALSGHRGGVTCIDVPSHIYRPDTVVTGGADGFIKLWSLRNPTGRRASNDLLSASSANLFSSPNLSGNPKDQLSQTRTKGSRGSDALSILSGHTGRVLCIKTAWHGDRLLSGGADRTLRIWDLAGSGGNGKCLHELRGHLG
jgi:WD40 repeat protein